RAGLGALLPVRRDAAGARSEVDGALSMSIATASQTIGPYWHLLEDKSWADLTRFGAEGERITLVGRVLDGDGAPFPEVCVELWQASPPASDRFPGFGRAATDKGGEYRF